MTFNTNFAQEREEYLLDLVRENRGGCFNPNCQNRNSPTAAATKKCSNCKVVAYCCKSCQVADWKRSHKSTCKLYCTNTAVDNRPNGNRQKGPVAIGLYSIGLIDDDILSKAMFDRTRSFIIESKKCIDFKKNSFGFTRPTINLEAAVIYDMEKIRLVCAASFHETGSSAFNPKIVTVNYVLFEVVGEGSEAERRRLHPPRGSGDISEECRQKVIEELYLFIRTCDDHEIAVQGITYGRGLLWMQEDEFQKGDQKKLIEDANDPDGKGRMIWMPDMGYAMENVMGGLMGAF